ncbi:hypothetical protein MMAD_56230 (plasmid) [Mycolicibacterium madagascariense]|uniref:TrbL/VirB6 plasmid conjugal transfer protein n=1 Tax=Mycolicibacterium madagascariense TaxID=212765 RepID=A0A7I7XQ26_9MYCO|nr:hypothetical protein [Mycolicibacterium madagascariense]BBZ31328.1 hypothetical protein MMAD_56230 [Mycolicibacterium madagascariense]
MTSGAVTLWLADHPRARRAVVTMTLTYTLSFVALLCAPNAVAAGGSAALGWTGLRDTDGVPVAFYFLSMVSVREAATNNGQDISMLDPSTWMPWMAAAMERAVDNATAAWWLGMIAGTFIFIMAAALWFLRFALSTGWLAAVATFAAPLYNAVNSLVNSMMLGPIAITICVTVAGYHILRGQPGRGWAMLGTAGVLTVLLATVFSDPISDLYSDHGLLALGRGTGLEIAQAATGAPFASGGSLDAKLDALMANVVTAGVRHPLQVLNFGMVVDDVGGCRQAWNTAIIGAGGVDGPGPAHAMASCGAPQALAYAQRLGGSDATIGLLLVLVAIVVAFFYFYVGLSAMMVGIKSLYFGILVGPSFLIGMLGFGRALAFAKHCGTELFMHVVQLMVFEVYLAVSAIGITWVLTTDAFGAATTTAIPRVLIMAVAAAALWLGFRFVDRSFHADSTGTIGRQISSAWHAGTGAVREETASSVARGVSARRRARRDAASGDQDSDSGSEARPTPGVEWFKPRSTSTAHTAVTGSGADTGAATTSAKSAAKSATTTAVMGAVKVAAPEVAVPVEAAAKAAGVANSTGHVLRSGKNANGAPPSRPASSGSADTSSPAPLRQPGPATAATPSSPVRAPAQAPTMASRGANQTSGRPSEAGSAPARGGDASAGTIDYDGPRQGDTAALRASRPPRPPREIGS